MERVSTATLRRWGYMLGLTTLALVAASPASAEDRFAAMGMGTGSCAQFFELRRVTPERGETYFFDWAQGYLSGWNAAQLVLDKPYYNLSAITVDEQKAFLRTYCEENPDSTYFRGVVRLQQRFPLVSRQSQPDKGE